MTDEQLKELVKRLERPIRQPWNGKTVPEADELLAASAIRQLMSEREGVLELAEQAAVDWEDASTLRDRIVALYASPRHPPAQS